MSFHNAWSSMNRVTDLLPATLYGVACYQAMVQSNWRHRYQAEWPAWYCEMFVDLNLSPTEQLAYQVSSPFDLRGTDDQGRPFRGDLKCHKPGPLILNDMARMQEALERDKQILIHTLEYDPIMDNGIERPVHDHWVSIKPTVKRESRGYKRMKASVTFRTEKLLAITPDNFKFLSDFKQGRNSDEKGSKRNPKFQITPKNEHHFLLESRNLNHLVPSVIS